MRDDIPLLNMLAAIAFALGCLTVPSSGQTRNDIPRYDLDDGRQWLESGAELNANSSMLLRGAAAAAFNEPSAERLLRSVIQSQPGSDAANQAHELLSRIYLRSGQYRRLIENLDRWATSFPNRTEMQSEKADVEQFRGLPDQRNGEKRVSILAHDPGDDWSVPLSINGKSATYLLDTGAWLSAMTESEATRLGLEIRAGSGTLGDPSGKGVTVRTAVAKDVRLGAMRFQQVSFAILPNEGPWGSMSPGKGGILGMPLVLAVDKLSGRTAGSGSWADGPNPWIERHGTSSSRKTACCSRRASLGRAPSASSIPVRWIPT